MRLLTCTGKTATPSDFVTFWRTDYSADPETDDKSYLEAIRHFVPLVRAADYENALVCLNALFKWKDPRNFSRDFVKRNWQLLLDGRLPEIIENPSYALQHILTGGRVWRIFFLHCCLPDECPIYDQHVHRATTFLQDEQAQEIDKLPDAKVFTFYLDRYRPFLADFARLASACPRDVDRALWAYGKALLSPKWLSTILHQPAAI